MKLYAYFKKLPEFQYGLLSGRIENYGEIVECEILEKELFGMSDLAGKTILDLGSGPGSWSLVFGMAGAHVIGIECDKRQIEFATKNQRAVKVDNVIFHECQAQKWLSDTLSESYDYVFLQHSFEHMDMPMFVVSEVFRVLKPSGRVWIALPNKDSVLRSNGEGHVGDYSMQDLEKMFSQFKLVYKTFIYTPVQCEAMRAIDGWRRTDNLVQRALSYISLAGIYRWFSGPFIRGINKGINSRYWKFKALDDNSPVNEQIYMVMEK